VIFAIPSVMQPFTNPLTTFGDAGTLAAFGFLLAYFMISIAAPMFLRRRGELTRGNLVIAGLSILCLLVPTYGSFYPVPPFPIRLFPYYFLAYMAVGGVWLTVASRRNPGVLAEIEADLEDAVDQHHLVDAMTAPAPSPHLAPAPQVTPAATSAP
jgi:amino acid transporter